MSSAAYDTQLPITRTPPCLGPSHHPSSHSEPAPDASEITEYLAAPTPTRSGPSSKLQPRWPPCCHSCQACSHLKVCAPLFPCLKGSSPALCTPAPSYPRVNSGTTLLTTSSSVPVSSFTLMPHLLTLNVYLFPHIFQPQEMQQEGRHCYLIH